MSAASRTAVPRILVVDDDPAVRAFLIRYLTLDGFDVIEAADGTIAMTAVIAQPPDLVVLDLNLAGVDGLDVLAAIRRLKNIPIILLTARGGEGDRVLGLRLGADDYLVKPFSPAELSVRISAVLHRSREVSDVSILRFDELSIDLRTREVQISGSLVATTAREFDLIAFMASAPRQVFSREQLLVHVWDSSTRWQDAATVTEYVRRVRRKIEPDPDHPTRLVTVRGIGYRFMP